MVDRQKCTGCATCMRICPVEAINLEEGNSKKTALIDAQRCLDCTICMLRCPEDAVRMVKRKTPMRVGVDITAVSQDEIARICHAAHMYPDQVICYCHRVQAKEVAAAILLGAKTPEDIARTTGARTGCGVLCITTVIRLLKAAGIELTKAPGYQWYSTDISIWNLPKTLQEKYKQYYIAEDLRSINALFPGGESDR